MNHYQARQWLALPFVVFVGTLLVTACGRSASDDKPDAGKLPEVGIIVAQLKAQPIVTELPGRTTARMIAEIRPQVGGIIQKRAFIEGANVKAGDLLYQIDPAPYRAAFASARAGVEKSEASLASLKSRAERYAELVKIDAVSKQDDDDIRASVRQGEADLSLSRAALETARINLDYTRIVAPISGRVDTSTVTPGALVTANQAAVLTTVQQLDPIYVDVTQSSNELLRLKRDLASGSLKKASSNEARIKVVLEDGNIYNHEGVLQVSGVTVNPTSGAVTLRAVVPNPEKLLLPGMYVRARLEQAVDETAILVPQQSVSRNTRGEATVLVVNHENKVELRALSADKSVGNQWLVTSGLETGDKVIVDGMQKIKVGDEVKPIEVATVADSPVAIQPPVVR